MKRILFLLTALFFVPPVWAQNQTASTQAPEPYKPISVIVPERALSAGDRELIQHAAPTEPIVKPKKERKILLFSLNVDYPGHRSVICASEAFKIIGQKTKAFTAVNSYDPNVFLPEYLYAYDAVVFNNGIGNLFSDPYVRELLEAFVKNGGGLLGIHGATDAFVHYGGDQKGEDDWPLFGEMLGARGTKHRESNERVFIKIDDPDHPLTQGFPKQGFDYTDEILRVTDPFSRTKVRVLLSVDNGKSDLFRAPYQNVKERDDEDYALAWVKRFGEGRVCYCAIGHSPKVFWDPMMLRFYLAAAQFVLGDLDGPAEPL